MLLNEIMASTRTLQRLEEIRLKNSIPVILLQIISIAGIINYQLHLFHYQIQWRALVFGHAELSRLTTRNIL
jgi:hypothetical protein